LSSVNDWDAIEGSTEQEVIDCFASRYWRDRAVGLVESLLLGLSQPLIHDALLRLEEMLESTVSGDALVDDILKAPIAMTRMAESTRNAALANGFAATASVFERILDLQPPLRRLTSIWLSLEPSAFDGLSRSPQSLWCTFVVGRAIRPLIEACAAREFQHLWNQYALQENSPSGRIAFQKLGTRLSKSLYDGCSVGEPESQSFAQDWSDGIEENTRRWQIDRRESKSSRERFDNAKVQIDAITAAINVGDDPNARKFLRDLVAAQVERKESQFAVKSLCNIAQRCADMLRYDFERECLDAALKLDPADVRSLTQFADHLKRQGRFQQAVEILDKAITLAVGDNLTVAESLKADVLSSRGLYLEAIDSYKQIDGWQNDPRIRGAIADNMRFYGNVAAARDLQEKLLHEDPGALGPQFGLAELDKMEGRLDESLNRYREISKRVGLDARTRRVCMMATAEVLKRMGRFRDAYQLMDNAVKQTPFDLRSRIQRGAILGLLNQTNNGLADLRRSEIGDPVAFNDWRKFYVQGLLLLQSGRHDEARDVLIARWAAAENAGEPDECLRLASAVAFLAENNPSEARRALSHCQTEPDAYLRHLRRVLELHMSISLNDKDQQQKCTESLNEFIKTQPLFRSAVNRLLKKDFSGALKIEIYLLLMAA